MDKYIKKWKQQQQESNNQTTTTSSEDTSNNNIKKRKNQDSTTLSNNNDNLLQSSTSTSLQSEPTLKKQKPTTTPQPSSSSLTNTTTIATINNSTSTSTTTNKNNNKKKFHLVDYLTENSWKTRLNDEFNKNYFIQLEKSLEVKFRENEKNIFPKKEEIFTALNVCPFDNVKVVILGQDPYPAWYAHGMSFSVKKGVAIPKSLQNIYKELSNNNNLSKPFIPPNHGYLMQWAQQGVLLLNAVLTVEKGKSNEHKGLGWENFTQKIIDLLMKEKEHVVYLLWGKDAQKRGSKINRSKNCVIECAHPSPFSASSGFFGSKCFEKAEKYLMEHQMTIDWQLTNN
ncbi:hypothetical protein ABK040_005012 [Willaertia magna]